MLGHSGGPQYTKSPNFQEQTTSTCICHILKCLNILQHVLVNDVITMYVKLFIVKCVEKPSQHVHSRVMNRDDV